MKQELGKALPGHSTHLLLRRFPRNAWTDPGSTEYFLGLWEPWIAMFSLTCP